MNKHVAKSSWPLEGNHLQVRQQGANIMAQVGFGRGNCTSCCVVKNIGDKLQKFGSH